MIEKSRILCDLVPETNTEEVPNEQAPTRYLAAVPMSKFLLWEIVWPQRRYENSSFEHAHYGALRFRTCAYRPVKGVEYHGRITFDQFFEILIKKKPIDRGQDLKISGNP
jgi:hypothetical protein